MHDRVRRIVCWGAIVSGAALLTMVSLNPDRFAAWPWRTLRGQYSVQDRVRQFGPNVRQRLESLLTASGLTYPPKQLALVAFKDTQVLELYGRSSKDDSWHLFATYPVLGSSGHLGPKLVEGDRQVPEGIYRVQDLNPNSRFHLAIRLNYPNDFDRRMAKADGRTQLGGDIMIHGGSSSIGCLAIGDQAAEDLFVLTSLVGIEQTQIVISPTDFRGSISAIAAPETPPWIDQLYDELRTVLESFPRRD